MEDVKGRMFAAAKKGNALGRSSAMGLDDLIGKGWKKTFSKKDEKSIAGEKKGFYICTRLARKRAKVR